MDNSSLMHGVINISWQITRLTGQRVITTTHGEQVTDNLFVALNLGPIGVHRPQVKWIC